jgi:hypothetical protein
MGFLSEMFMCDDMKEGYKVMYADLVHDAKGNEIGHKCKICSGNHSRFCCPYGVCKLCEHHHLMTNHRCKLCGLAGETSHNKRDCPKKPSGMSRY